MRPLRVLRIISGMHVGGAASQVTALMRGLDPDRFEQRLYAGPVDPGEGDYRRLRARDVPVRALPPLRRSARPTGNLRALVALTAAIREFQPDLVHTHSGPAGALGRLAAAACRVPIRVHTVHGHLPPGRHPAAAARIVAATERALSRTSDALVVAGTRVRDELLAAGVGRPDQYAVMRPAASLPPVPDRDLARRALGLAGPGPVVAYVGRVTAAKRLDRLLAVARAARRAVPGARFVICGEGDALAATVAAATADGLDVTFLPWRADVETVYAAADLVLRAADQEGTLVSLIEAALAGRPVVAADVGAVREVVRHGRTGLLAGRDDLDGMCRAVLRLLRDDDLRRRMGQLALADAREAFGTPRLVAATRDLYRRLAMERGLWSSEPIGPPPLALAGRAR